MDSSSDSPLPHGRRKLAAAMLAVLALVLLPLAGAPPTTNPNELVRLELAIALAELGTIDLEPTARVYGLSEDVARHRGRILADKAPGLSLAAVPVVRLAGPWLDAAPGSDLPAYWPLRHLSTGLVVACAVVLSMAWLARDSGLSNRVAAWPLLVLATLATPLWSYGTVFFGHGAAAALITVAWVLLVGSGDGCERPKTGGAALAGGFAAGLAISTEYPTVILAAVMLATLAARRTPARRLLAAASGLAAGLLPAAVYHHVAFGAPWLTGYAFKADAGFASIHATGVAGVSWPTMAALWGVLGSSARGLFFFSPLLLLAPIGLVVLVRRGGWRNAAPPLLGIAAYVLFAAGFVDWTAGWCAAARHLVPVIPVLLVPTFAAVAAASRRPWLSVVVAMLAVVSVLRSVLTVALTPFFPPEFDRPLTQLVVPSLAEGHAAANLLSAVFGTPAWIIWIAAAAAACTAAAWASARLSSGAGKWTTGATVLVLAVQLAWISDMGSRLDPQLEAYRARVLANLGHRAAEVTPGVEGTAPTHPSPVERPP